MVDPIQKEAYWRIVEATLTDIFNLDPDSAYERTTELRLHLAASREQRASVDTFYHQEPLTVAETLAGESVSDIDLEEVRSRYEAIRARFNRLTQGAPSGGRVEE